MEVIMASLGACTAQVPWHPEADGRLRAIRPSPFFCTSRFFSQNRVNGTRTKVNCFVKQFVLLDFFLDLFRRRKIIFQLAKIDFKTRYLGTYLGLVWAFIQPLITLVIIWLVFEIGFKAKPIENVPFIIWLIAGIVPWFFFADSVQNGSNCLIENSYLVKKIVFRVSLLPIVKVISSAVIHLFFILLIAVLLTAYGITPSWHWLQVIYYFFAMILLIVGLTWLFSSLIVFLRDLSQLIVMCLQFGFWLTPIFWSVAMVPEKYRWILRLNPCLYFVDGYRNTFIYRRWFWEDPLYATYYWGLTLFILLCGVLAFRKLKPHFADVI
jgi:lipopolysaccharide transport system permease protein/teichoic acid transport system permease protein